MIILGPTCVGKTGASILLAKALATEIISSDSMQIYRHMDVGTAKPSPQERASVKHHMIDIAEPSEGFSAGKFIDTVTLVIDDLHRREKMPVVVGGTGLYIKVMTRGIFTGPPADWALREELLTREEETEGSLYACLAKLDPEAAQVIKPTDIRRLIRALEVCLKTSERISILQKKHTKSLPYEFIKIGLTRDRGELYKLIERRVDAMLAKGFVFEVARLLNMNPGRTALQAIGYKEIAAYVMEETSLDEAIMLIKQRTRNYAKRQATWFKKEAGIKWVDVTGLFEPDEIYKAITGVCPGLYRAGRELSV